MPYTPPTNPEDSYELSPFGFGPFPVPGQSVEVAPPHPVGGGFGGVGFIAQGEGVTGGTPFGLGSYGSRWFGRPRVNVSGGYGGDPYGVGGYGGTERTPPAVTSAISISGFEVELFFSEEMAVTEALTDPASYTLVPVSGAAPVTVLSVHIEQLGSVNMQAGDTIAGAISVVLTHTGTTLGGMYRVHTTGLTDIAGNSVLDTQVSFLARGSAPAFAASLPSPDPGNKVLLTFAQDMLRAVDEPGAGPGIEDTASYEFSGDYPITATPLAVEHLTNPREVLLTVQGMTSIDYTVTVGPAFAFSYNLTSGLVNAVRVDTGVGTATTSGTNLVVGRLANNAFGLEWQDQSGVIVPLVSTLRMDCRYDFSNASFNPAITLFPLPEILDVVFQDGVAGNGILVRYTLQYGAGGAEQIRIRSGTYDVTVTATWSGGPHTLSLVRNQKAGTVSFLLDDHPLSATAMGNVDGVPETQAGIRFVLLDGGWDLTGVRLQDVRATSSTTVYSQAWNFLHDGTTVFEGSDVLTRDVLLTQRGPLVKAWGDATPATVQDVVVTVNDVEVEVADVNPYLGAVRLAVPIPRLPPGDAQADVKVDYQWFKSPVMELAGLNTPGLVLNKFDCSRRGHHEPASHGDAVEVKPGNGVPMSAAKPKGAVDIHRFPMSVVLGPMTRAKPLYIGHRYLGFERSYSALTNSPTTLLLNQAPGRASVPGFGRTVQGVSVAYEGLVKPVDAAPAWALQGTDFGGVDHDAVTGLDKGTYTVIDAKTGAYSPTDMQGVVYHRGVDLSAPSSVYMVVRFQASSGALFDTDHLDPGGVVSTATTEGVFTGIGFGIHDNQKLYLCGVLRVNEVEHVGLLLDPLRPHEATSWVLGPQSILTAETQDSGVFPTTQVPVGFGEGSRFQILTGTQVGVYTATSVTNLINGTTRVSFTPDLPEPWDVWDNKYPVAVFETRASSKPFTYRLDIHTDQQIAELRVSGETQGVVAAIDGNVPALPAPAATSLLIPVAGLGKSFWGSLSRQAASRATWSFSRYGVIPDQVFLQGHAVVVNTEMDTLPENSEARWFPHQMFGEARIENPSELLLKAGNAHPTLDFSFGYSKTEPFLSPDALFDIQARFSVDTGILGSGDVEVSFDTTQRVVKLVPLLYQEGFPGTTTYRRLIHLPEVSLSGFTEPETLGWSASTGSTLTPVVEGAQLVAVQTASSRGGWTKDLDWSGTNVVSTDEGRLFEARLAVKAFTVNASGDTGIRFGCQMPAVGAGNVVVQVELRGGATPGVRLRTATGAPVAQYDFDWTDEEPHTYRVQADRNGDTVTLVIDDTVQLPVAALTSFSGGSNAAEGFFGCYGVNGSNVADASLTSTVEWYHFHCHVLPPATARRTLGVWLGGDKTDIDSFEIPRTDSSAAANSWQTGPVIEQMDWRTPLEVRIYHDPGWGVTVYRPDLPAPPYYQSEDGSVSSGFITSTTEPSAGWINVEYQNLPRSSSNLLGRVNFGSLDGRSISQSRWEWVRYRMVKHPTEDRIAPEHMVLNQYNVISSGEVTKGTTVEHVVLVTLDKTRVTLLPTHLYAKSIYKIIDGATIWTSEDWTFDPGSQMVTLQPNPTTGEAKEFSSEHANVTIYFIPGHPVTNTYLLNQPLLEGITLLNEGTPPVPKSQTGTAEKVEIDGVLTYRDVPGTLYESLDFFEGTDEGVTGLLASICEGGPGTGFSGLAEDEGEDIYSPDGDGDPLNGTGHVAGHFATGEKVGKAVGAEVFDFSGTLFWQDANFPASPSFTQKGGSLGGILFASGGSFTNPVVDGAGNIVPGALVAGGGTLGPGSAVLWPSFPARGPVGGDQGRIYKRTDWFIRILPGAEDAEGLNPRDAFSLEGVDQVAPSYDASWNPNPGAAAHALGSAQGTLVYAGQYSRIGPWGGLGNLTPNLDYGTIKVVNPVDGHQVRVWDPVLAAWVTFTARTVPVAATDFAVAPTPHVALAAAINAYSFSLPMIAQAGLTLNGQLMVRVSSRHPVDLFSNPIYLQTPHVTGFVLADVALISSTTGLLLNGSGMFQSSLLAGGTQLGARTAVPDLSLGMVAQGGSALPQGAQFNLNFHAV